MRNTKFPTGYTTGALGCIFLTYGLMIIASIAVVLGWWLWLYPSILRALGWF